MLAAVAFFPFVGRNTEVGERGIGILPPGRRELSSSIVHRSHHHEMMTSRRRRRGLGAKTALWMTLVSICFFSTLVSRQVRVVALSSPLPVPSPSRQGSYHSFRSSMPRRLPKRIIVDTDAGFDDLVALTCPLAHGHSIDLVTTVCGSNTALDTHHALERLLSSGLDNRVVPSKNRPRPSQAWLTDFRRRFGAFVERHGTTTPTQSPLQKSSNGDDDDDDDGMTTRVKQFLQNSPDDGVDLLCLGPLSNVADWMERFPDLMMTKVSSVWILGGSHPTTERVDEFNFGQDAPAASYVFEGRLADKITLVPGDVTSHHLVADDFIPTIVEAACRNQELASTDYNVNTKLLAHIIEEEQQYSIFYDPVCIFLYLHPEAARFARVPLRVDPESGATQSSSGTTAMIPFAEQVNFDAYQAWLLQAIQQSSDAQSSCTEEAQTNLE
eukprot:scaffold12214_cov159-Amphora_coffeaeformis.AAC.6